MASFEVSVDKRLQNDAAGADPCDYFEIFHLSRRRKDDDRYVGN